MNYRLELELKVAWQMLDKLERELEEKEKEGDKHVATIKFGQIISMKQHIESLERIADHIEQVKETKKQVV